MADKEVRELEYAEVAAKKRVEFWASTVDAFLQEFLEKAKVDDRLGTIVAAARLAQIGSAISEEYIASLKSLVDSDTELKVAQQAAAQVVTLVNKNTEACVKLRSETVPGWNGTDAAVPQVAFKKGTSN